MKILPQKNQDFFYRYNPGGECSTPLPPPHSKIRSRHSGELKLTALIAYIIFYKICQFASSAKTNDVIMSLPETLANSELRETRQIIHHSKGIDKSFLNTYFSLNVSHCVQHYGHLCQISAFLRCPLT